MKALRDARAGDDDAREADDDVRQAYDDARETNDDARVGDDGLRLHASRTVRVALVAVGTSSLALGVIGIFVPVLPTTPFVLLAAGCYARASTRFHRWLTRSRVFGPMIREWQLHRSIRYRTKLFAIAMMASTLAVSIVFFGAPGGLMGLGAAFGLGLAACMNRIPSRDAPGRSSDAAG